MNRHTSLHPMNKGPLNPKDFNENHAESPKISAISDNCAEKGKGSRSNSSPRLKSFPPEELKKSDDSSLRKVKPMAEPISTPLLEQKPQRSGGVYMPQSENQIYANVPTLSENTIMANEEVANRGNHRDDHPYPPSESASTQHHPCLPGNRIHWPFTPDPSRSTTVSPSAQTTKKSPLPVMIQRSHSSMQYPQVSSPSSKEANATIRRSLDNRENIPAEEVLGKAYYDDWLIGRKNAATYHRIRPMQHVSCVTSPASLNPPDNGPALSSQPSSRIVQLNQQSNSRATYQPLQRNIIEREMMMSDGTMDEELRRTAVPQQYPPHHSHPELERFLPGPGMTSPQDMTVNRLKCTRNAGGATIGRDDTMMDVTNGHGMVPRQIPFDRNENHNDSAAQRGVEKKILRFTPAMIRDQELLVRTMKQQGVPEDIMRRQFDSLLNEQRRHLTYAHVTRQEDKRQDVGKRNEEPVMRRKMPVNEKPEWMVHITPPRLSYSEMEKLREEEESWKNSVNELAAISQETQPESHNQFNVRVSQEQTYHWPTTQNYVPCGPYDRTNEPLMSVPNVTTDFNAFPRTIYPGPSFHCHPHHHHCPPPTAPPSSYQRPVPFYLDQQRQQQQHQPVRQSDRAIVRHNANVEQTTPRTEPSSLLKLRLYRDVIRPQKRNNGLQDPETVRKVLETLKDAESRKGLEYLAELTKKKRVVRFNGIQDPCEIATDVRVRPSTDSSGQPTQRRVSANGLENTRNPNNPPVQRLKSCRNTNESEIAEYPRQRQSCVIRGDRGNGSEIILPCNERNLNVGHSLLGTHGEGDVGTMKKIDISAARHGHCAGGDNAEATTRYADSRHIPGETKESAHQTCFVGMPNVFYTMEDILREPRTIGGITYLARRPNYIPNPQVLLPENFTLNRCGQPTVSH